MPLGRCKLALVSVLALCPMLSSCALFASANAAHSHISPCVSDVGYSVVDLVLAAAFTAVLVGTETVDETPAAMILPGVFVTSGVVGAIYADRCRKRTGSPEAPVLLGPAYPPQSAVPPSARVQTDAVPATAEELGLPAAEPGQPAVRLQLPPDYQLPASPATPQDGSPGVLECGPALPSACPAGEHCELRGALGTCVADPPPPATP